MTVLPTTEDAPGFVSDQSSLSDLSSSMFSESQSRSVSPSTRAALPTRPRGQSPVTRASPLQKAHQPDSSDSDDDDDAPIGSKDKQKGRASGKKKKKKKQEPMVAKKGDKTKR